MTETKKDKESYSGCIVKSGIRCFKAIGKVQEYQREAKTRKLIFRDQTGFSETVCEQRTANHFVFKCTKFAHRLRKTWPGLKGRFGHMIGVSKLEEG